MFLLLEAAIIFGSHDHFNKSRDLKTKTPKTPDYSNQMLFPFLSQALNFLPLNGITVSAVDSAVCGPGFEP